jgi:Apea-like HEPN
MFKAFVLIRNLESSAKRLDFGEFTVELVGLRFKELREVFSSIDVNQDDWIFEKLYTVPPPGPPGSPVGGIPNDIEDILLLFRLYKAGDISFVKQAIIPPGGNTVVQFPYRAMNDLNSYSPLRFELGSEECESWKVFANAIRGSQSWNSEWVSVSRRFFLYGGAKEFNPKWDDVDRILDYVTALEAAVVPEMDFARRRISRRSAMLISSAPTEQSVIATLVKQLYDIRSSVVHGSKLSDEKRDWLIENCGQVELRVRQVLTAAVQNVPAEEADRRTMLAALYDPADEDRGEFALQKFQEIKTPEVRKAIAAKVAKLAGE